MVELTNLVERKSEAGLYGINATGEFDMWEIFCFKNVVKSPL